MLIKENVTVYQCEHCKKKLFRKHAMEKHEKNCGADPQNQRVCSLCDFMVRKNIEYYYDCWDGEHTGTSNGFYCNRLGKFMYPNFIENKPFFKENPEQFEEQIPFKKECEYYTLGGVHFGIEKK